MHYEAGPVARAAGALQERFGDAPRLAIVLGSGLGPLLDAVERTHECGYSELELPGPSVAGHTGLAVRGRVGGAEVIILAGRVHFYEGYSQSELVRGVRALKEWGVQRLLLTCAAGGIAEEMVPGDLALISDHLNFQGDSPLRGPTWGSVRFPDMSEAYSPSMRETLRGAAGRAEMPLHEGVYACMNGPSYETPAEVRMLHAVGADLVGMSTVPEVIAAVQGGLEVAAIAMVSNRAAGLAGAVLDHEDVQHVASQAAAKLAVLLEDACMRL